MTISDPPPLPIAIWYHNDPGHRERLPICPTCTHNRAWYLSLINEHVTCWDCIKGDKWQRCFSAKELW